LCSSTSLRISVAVYSLPTLSRLRDTGRTGPHPARTRDIRRRARRDAARAGNQPFKSLLHKRRWVLRAGREQGPIDHHSQPANDQQSSQRRPDQSLPQQPRAAVPSRRYMQSHTDLLDNNDPAGAHRRHPYKPTARRPESPDPPAELRSRLSQTSGAGDCTRNWLIPRPSAPGIDEGRPYSVKSMGCQR
jgi:hypothetical protein